MDTRIIKRDIVEKLEKYLDTDNIIVLHGARQVGKTCILYFLRNYLSDKGKSVFYFDLEDSRLVEVLDDGLDSLFSYLKNEGFDLEVMKDEGKKLYLFIDEIQYLTNPSSLLKLLGDHHKYLQLIVSGSSSFDIKSKFSDSLVGRTVNFEVFNLSFSEFLRFKNIRIDPKNCLDKIHLYKLIRLYKEFVSYGGYPKIVLEEDIGKKEMYLQQIVDTYVRKDIRDLADVKDTKKFNNLLAVLASQSGQLVNISKLADVCSLAKQTVEKYLFILENTYIIKLLTPFSQSAKVEVVKTPKIFFYDTGILQILWLKHLQRNLLGTTFETSIFSELVKRYGSDNIHFWRNRNQNEIDFILTIQGMILPVEVKENFRNFNRRSILSFCQKYHCKTYKVVSLFGEKQGPSYIFPWNL